MTIAVKAEIPSETNRLATGTLAPFYGTDEMNGGLATFVPCNRSQANLMIDYDRFWNERLAPD